MSLPCYTSTVLLLIVENSEGEIGTHTDNIVIS
jgi:hypothetical protein